MPQSTLWPRISHAYAWTESSFYIIFFNFYMNAFTPLKKWAFRPTAFLVASLERILGIWQAKLHLCNCNTPIISLTTERQTGYTLQSHSQESEKKLCNSSIKTPAQRRLHINLPFSMLTALPGLEKRLGIATERHNFCPNERHNTTTTPTHAILAYQLSAFCACVDDHNKPANSACRSVADMYTISYLNENISDKRAPSISVHIINRFFQYSTPTVTTHTAVY